MDQRPLTLKEAYDRVQSCFEQPCVRLIQPTEHDRSLFQKTLKERNAAGNLLSDAHLAALTVEHNCVLQSTDTDFARFPSLKWNNPIRAS